MRFQKYPDTCGRGLNIVWIERCFYAFLCVTFDRVALELLSVLYRFENSAKCGEKPVSSDPFQNS